ncbi:hypothetical protein LTR17_006135 [Elasticomyces elasticus]|nr:hypothetical protein LTR17_006135 [Elasticomyces elasticus]
MAAVITSYSHAFVQRLPMLESAREEYLGAGGDDLIGQFRDLFVRAGMDTKFGLSMIHRHFDLPEGHQLVEYNGTSTPWSPIPGMEQPKPHMWAFDREDGLLKPTEFRYTKQADDITFGREELDFLLELKGKLDELGLLHLFGVARYPGDEFPGSCEITQGMTNINLQPKDMV